MLSLLAALPVHFVEGQVYQASASPVAPQWIKPSSGPVAVIGINLSQNSGEKLQAVSVNITDDGGSTAFTTLDLAPLSVDPSSGVGLYIDNKTGGTSGAFDGADTPVALSAVPQWTVDGSTFRTTLKTGGTDIPTNDLGNNSGPDFFVVVRTSALASQGQNFSAHLESGDVRTDGGAIVFAPADTGTITVDDERPNAVAGPDMTTDEGVEVGFSGAGSTDNIGIANYTWLFSDFGPDSEAFGVYVTHTFNSPGRFMVVLNVTDYAGNSDESTVLVTVRAVNHPPVITSSPPLSAVQGTTYIYLIQAYDEDGDALRYFESDGPTNLTINSTDGLTVWTPGPYDVGSKFVSLAVTDDKSPPARQSFWITVENVNDPPFFTSLPVLTATQNQPYIYKAQATDPDNNEQLVFSLVAGPRGMTIGPYTGVVSWTPAWDQVSTIRVVIAVSDRQYTVYQDFCITVANTNDPPVFNSVPPTSALQGVPYTYQVNATDPDGDDIRFFLNPAPAGMKIDVATGLVTWTPSPDQVGTAFVRLEARDIRGATSDQSFYITVVNVNDPPVIISSPPASAVQGSPFSYLVQAFDPDGDQVTFSFLAEPPDMTINSSSGLIEWVPDRESVGKVSVAVLASDGHGGIGVQSFQLTVLPTNEAPVVVDSGDLVAYQDQPFIMQVRAFDPNGDDITFSLITNRTDIDLNRTTGILVWYPGWTQPGDYHFAVRVTDSSSLTADAILHITLRPTNEPPHIQPIGILHAKVGQRFTYRVQVDDPDKDALTFSSTSRLFSINSSSGETSFIPDAGQVGVHGFTVWVTDAGGLNDNAWGVLVVSQDSGGPTPFKIAGYGLAGIGATIPGLVLLISLALGAILLYEYSSLRRREKEDRKSEEESGARTPAVTEGAKVQARKAGGVTEEERMALEATRMRDGGRVEAPEAEPTEKDKRERDEGAPVKAGLILTKEEQERLEREVEEELASLGPAPGTGGDSPRAEAPGKKSKPHKRTGKRG